MSPCHHRRRPLLQQVLQPHHPPPPRPRQSPLYHPFLNTTFHTANQKSEFTSAGRFVGSCHVVVVSGLYNGSLMLLQSLDHLDQLSAHKPTTWYQSRGKGEGSATERSDRKEHRRRGVGGNAMGTERSGASRRHVLGSDRICDWPVWIRQLNKFHLWHRGATVLEYFGFGWRRGNHEPDLAIAKDGKLHRFLY